MKEKITRRRFLKSTGGALAITSLGAGAIHNLAGQATSAGKGKMIPKRVLGETGEKVSLKDFYMSIFPVTNREYRCFVDAGGYKEMRFWQDKGWQEKKTNNWKEPAFWDDSCFNHDCSRWSA